ncbi:MAG TPA: D-alanyl-D-alanine carboxypeptidase/D-alanyl-D-alanine-endopeptidase [Rhodanobacteraceae bacterium]
MGLAPWAAAQAPAAVPSAQTLAARIDQFIARPQFAHARWGIAVRSLDSGKVLYTHAADKLFVPASNAKLFTTALALADLGPDTRIATTLYATSLRVNAAGVLHGNLILYGRGDPSLGLPKASPDWAERMAAAVAALGVKRIKGNLIADATYFKGIPVGAGWEANDLQSWYGAVPSALDVDGNLLHVTVTREGRRCCAVSATPDAADVHVANLTATDPDVPLGLYRPPGSSTLYAIGHLPGSARRQVYALSMPRPALAAGNLLRQALARHRIRLTGHVRVVRWPQPDPALRGAGTHAIASVDSPTIAALVVHTLKNSDNLFAQSLLLQVGAAAAQRHACCAPTAPHTSVGWGLCALHDLLAKAGIPPGSVRLVEGSGLAREDLVAPNALVQWLTWTATQPWGTNLRDALPVGGVDGTLQARFRDGRGTNNVQAKTGTLSHIYTLTGFVTDAAHERLVFSILLNGYPRWAVASEDPDAGSPQHALDTVARMLASYGAH